MKVTINSSVLTGTVTAPASKSAMQRACAAALVRKGTTRLLNPGVSADDKAALGIIRQLGADIEESNGSVVIRSQGVSARGKEINCGESGLSIRMFTPIAALSPEPIRITGTGSLQKRPMHFFDEVLPQLGAATNSNEGFLPLTVQGPLRPANITIDGSLSSQFLTGLLFAYAAAEASDVTISVNNLNSKPYIDLTLETLKRFGLKVPENNKYESFHFNGSSGALNQTDLEYQVEGDWSGGAFLLVAGAVNGTLEVRGLDVYSTQADKAILQVLMQAGAAMSIREDAIEIRRSALRAFHFNATDCPDLFPPLVALAAFCEGASSIEGVHRLTHKESDRAATLQEEFGKMGITVRLQNDLMLVEGGKAILPAAAHSHHDHRIAMACAIAALNATGPVSIEDAGAVNKSYPQFWNHLQELGGSVTIA
jgi:3-phosphoshikimate 1-carboxyvinyltransferase